MLVTGRLMLVEDPVFSGDKLNNDFFQIQQPETSIQNLYEFWYFEMIAVMEVQK